MREVKLQDVQLQALRIPTGWTVIWNQFYEVEPDADIEIAGLPDGDVWELFLQDLLQLQNGNRKLLLDLGWVPEANPQGRYKLTLVENEDWIHPVATYESRDKDDIVEQIDLWLIKIASGEM